MEKNGVTLILIEKKNNLFYLKAKVKNILAHNVTMAQQEDEAAIVSDGDDVEIVPTKKTVVDTSIDKPSATYANILKNLSNLHLDQQKTQICIR